VNVDDESAIRSAAVDFIVRQADLGSHRFDEVPHLETLELETDDVALRIERFAFTANNVTYAVLGRSMSFFGFFPAETGWGRIPVWGMATIARTSREDLTQGARFYGYFPMSSYVVVRPSKVTQRSFIDAMPRRRDLPPLYNTYSRMLPEFGFAPELDHIQLLLRPVFITSFILDDLLDAEAAFGARVVIISSASSKTAIGLAHLLAKRKRNGAASVEIEVIGLTSARNKSFVENLELYDRVATYDAIDAFDPHLPAVLIDMAGNAAVRKALRDRLGPRFLRSIGIGATHWDHLARRDALGADDSEAFFAPARIAKRIEDWGGAGFAARFAEALSGFAATVAHESDPWLRVREELGPDALLRVYEATRTGNVDPRDGFVLGL